jgi:hypothetical protein
MVSVQAIADRASTYSPARAVLTVLTVPFYVLGVLAAVLWLAGAWVVAGARQGFDDARDRAAGAADRDSS